MTWGNRFKLLLGMLVVLLIVAGSTLIFNQRQTQVLSTSATIASQEAAVGSDYGGIITESYVQAGDQVVEGQRMYVIESLQLLRDLELGAVSADLAQVREDGTYVVRANASGTVADGPATDGTYVGTGDVLATINREGSLFAEAEFILTARDFGRIEDGATVELRLPDQTTLTGNVSDITVETIDGSAHVTARVDSVELVEGDSNNLVKPGTPLDATLELRDDGPLAGVNDAVTDFATKIGL
ncbi:HlyD family efflux transporter periplasmic adaptor subunit [Demequina sp.]|uniref:HlyD family efflux transporter periplasmic adaptor subunit n=1 Tax=Demequina sp. TaxID=2050685 RepID=UPI003A88D3C4